MGGEVGDFFEDVLDFAEDIVDSVVDFVEDTFKSIEKTVSAIIKDPLPTILMIAGQSVGIPPYVTSAVITAARGGDLEDVAKSAAVAYVSSQVMTQTGIGQQIGSTTSSLGQDFTNSLIENFNLPSTVAAGIGRAATAGLNSAIIGGVRAGLTGQDVSDAIASGFTSGAVYSSTNSFFDEVNKNPNWGLSQKSLDYIKGGTSSALNAIINNQDPAAAVGNFIAYSTVKLAESEVKKKADQFVAEFKSATDKAQQSQDSYEALKDRYDERVVEYENLRTDAQVKSDEYNRIIKEEYTPFQTDYENRSKEIQSKIDEYNKHVAEYEKYKAAGDSTNANKYADLANKLAPQIDALSTDLKKFVESRQPMLDRLSSIQTDVTAKNDQLKIILADIEKPTGNNLASQLKTAADKFQQDYDLYKTSEERTTAAIETYNKMIVDVATRDALIDAVNNSVLFPISTDEKGNYLLNNGLTLGMDGKFYEGDKQLFLNAAGTNQKALNFTDYEGNMIAFGENAGRRLSQSDVQNLFSRDYGIDISADEAKQFKDLPYTNFDRSRLQDFALDKISDEYERIAGKSLSKEEAGKYVNVGGNSVQDAQLSAINMLDLPDDYISPGASADQKISFAQAYAENRAYLGPGRTFTWNGKEYSTDNKEEKLFKEAVYDATGDFDNRDVNFVKAKLSEAIKTSNITGAYSDSNPADLSEKEMNAFVNKYVSSGTDERARLLRGSDGATYKVINDYLQSYAGSSERTSGQTYVPPAGFGSISASDMTNYQQVVNAGLRGAGADLLGLGVRAGQTIGELVGYDTPTLDRMQELLTKDKETQMSKLVGDERAVAGGISSGLSSALSWALGGPAASLATLGGVAANNAWIEGSQSVIDQNGNTWNSEEEAKKNGVWTYRKLTPEENGLRTAVMTSLEIAGEAFGVPGMSKLMKGIPITGDVGVIVNAVKNFGLGLGREEVAELLTTTAQMAADKYLDVGLGKNASFEDYKNALIDTAIATAASVGTAGSVGSAIENIRNAANSVNVFSIDTREEVDPTLSSIQSIYKPYGFDDKKILDVYNNIANTIDIGGTGLDVVKEDTKAALQEAGVTKVRSEVLAEEMVDRVLNTDIERKLISSGIDPIIVPNLINPIYNDIRNQVGTSDFLTNLNSSFSQLNLDNQVINNAINSLSDVNVFAIDEVKNLAKQEGYTISDEEAASVARQAKEDEAAKEYQQKIDPLAVNAQEAQEFFDFFGYPPNQQELNQFIQSKQETEVKENIRSYVDPRQMTQEEVETLFGQRGYTFKPEEVTPFVRQGPEVQQQAVAQEVESYLDPRMISVPELMEYYRSMGIEEPSPGDVTPYIGQMNEAEVFKDLAAKQDALRMNALKYQTQKSADAAQRAQLGQMAMGALSQAAPQIIAGDEKSEPLQPFLTSRTKQEAFSGPLQEFLQEAKGADYTESQFLSPSVEQESQMAENMPKGEFMPNYFTYGEPTDIDRLFSQPAGFENQFFPSNQLFARSGGLATPLMAGGGLPVVHHSGKMRRDYRQGDAVSGPGDGQSDDIPAMLADGEFVIPADVVAALGNGSTKAGSDKLYDMMHSVRAHHRSAKPQDLPPAAKASPLDYLRKGKR